jgi:heme/copper-type cytochrome/quinol oxidase subunit 2
MGNIALDPGSPELQAVTGSLGFIFVVSALVIALAVLVLFVSAIQSRRHPARGTPVWEGARRGAEIAWAGGALVLLAAAFFLAVSTIQTDDPPPGNPESNREALEHAWRRSVGYEYRMARPGEGPLQRGRCLVARFESAALAPLPRVLPSEGQTDLERGDEILDGAKAGEPDTSVIICSPSHRSRDTWRLVWTTASSRSGLYYWERGENRAEGDRDSNRLFGHASLCTSNSIQFSCNE